MASSASKPGPRGPNAERSAATRRRILEATVACLNDLGFAATTMQQVLEAGGVSRGALLHHFATRVDLMVAVADHCARAQNRLVAVRLAGIANPLDQFLALTDAAWDATQSRTGVAFIEIMLGGRSEPGLNVKLADLIRRAEQAQRSDVWRLGEACGMHDLEKQVEVMSRLHTAAMRGLVLERLCSPRDDDVQPCLTLLNDYKRHISGRLLTGDIKASS